jgi:hypothetical protein
VRVLKRGQKGNRVDVTAKHRERLLFRLDNVRLLMLHQVAFVDDFYGHGIRLVFVLGLDDLQVDGEATEPKGRTYGRKGSLAQATTKYEDKTAQVFGGAYGAMSVKAESVARTDASTISSSAMIALCTFKQSPLCFDGATKRLWRYFI